VHTTKAEAGCGQP